MFRQAILALLVTTLLSQTSGWDAGAEQAKPRYHKPSSAELKRLLTSEQFAVTQQEATEKPFKNLYWDHHAEGIYVDIVSGEPLFSSRDKFDSKTGWPSFTKPLVAAHIRERQDSTLGLFSRTEVRSKYGDSHLGHVFGDGPAPTGLRYCINSAALRFVPVRKLQEEGYGDYLPHFTATLSAAKQANASQPERGKQPEQGAPQQEVAVFAGGCFWCMEPPFESLPGVKEVVSGYTGGSKERPSYAEVSAGQSGHWEAVELRFDPAIISYEKLLEVFWVNIDPFDATGQFCDKGSQYRSAIFYLSEEQKQAAEASKNRLLKDKTLGGASLATEIRAASPFYPAEDDHQDYYRKNPLRYKFYRNSCGRDKRLDELWSSQRKLKEF